MYKSTSNSFDSLLQYREIFTGSVTIQNICTSAMAEGNMYIIDNPEAVIFDDDGLVIDFMYDDIFERACARIRSVIKMARERRAVRATVSVRHAT